MGGCLPKEDKEAKRKNMEIEKEMMKEKEKDEKTIKLLLLGAGESGKSTVLKQMRIMNDDGFSEEEINQQRSVVFNNTVTSMGSILRAMNSLGIALGDGQREGDAVIVMEVISAGDESEPFTPELTSSLHALWKDSGVQEAFERRNEYQLNDSANYFLDALDRICEKGYKPTQDDMLHTRVKTTGIVEIGFQMKDMDFRVFDVGGQRSERKKWIHCFEDVNAVIFITAMSEYDQVLFEDETTNRMQESMRLFESICNSKWFTKTSMILFFNKKDLFADKVKKSKLTIAFPEYDGPQDYDNCAKYIEIKFSELNENIEKTVYMHQTCATDTNQVQLVLNSVIDMIIGQNLAGSGLY